MTRQDLKAAAKQQIKGNIGILFVITLIISAISSICFAIPAVGWIADVFILAPGFALSTYIIYLDLTQGAKPEIADAFIGLKNFWAAFKTTFLVGLFTYLWSLLFVIPGIIKCISYSQAMYIVAENPEIGALEAINRSKKMMAGHKMDYFVMLLSFLGWAILGGFTFGILYIWLIPYMQATFANFYNSIKPVAQAPTAAPAAEPVAEPVKETIAE